MEAFVWNDRFATGLAPVDGQHRHLVDLVNYVGDQLLNATEFSEKKLQELFHQLADYARFHFTDEERIMAEAGLAPEFIRLHTAHHREFTKQVTVMWQARGTMKSPGETLHGFLSAWLTFHILGEDLSMARQIERVRQGMNPEAAYGMESQAADTPTAALLEALQKLYGVLSRQNRDLADANQELEQKVADRMRELLQSEKMASVGQLAAGVAHEINNPIGFVTSNLGTLGSYVAQLLPLAALGAATPEGRAMSAAADLEFLRTDLPELLAESRQGLERVRRIVADLKDFAHVDEADWQRANLVTGLESTLNVLSYELRDKATVIQEVAPLPLVRCIPAQINQVFMSLLLNAAQSLTSPGTITLATGHTAHRVWVEVRDSGCGMDEATRQRIFEPFFTTRPVGRGVGLGLSLVWDIVKKHGGTIEVASEPGQGSTFRIWLPIEGPEAEEVQA